MVSGSIRILFECKSLCLNLISFQNANVDLSFPSITALRISPNSTLYPKKHFQKLTRGYEHIVDDEPDYGGFLRGRVASNFGPQLIVVYCRPESLAEKGEKLDQFLKGMKQIPVALDNSALVISDNGDMYGTYRDCQERGMNS
ncbi:MAG: hypothetical protein IPG24_28525 [Leptospiraceae bacterium]|nr:hypothetical protein [Leptospiraceae bacterium]